MPATASKDAQNDLKHRGRARRKAGVTRLVVELAGLGVQGGSLLDGAEAGDAEGLTGLGDGVDPATDVLELTAAEGLSLLGDDLSALALGEHVLGGSAHGLLASSVPYLAAGSTDANTTGHFELLSLCERATSGIRLGMHVTG